MIYQFVVLNNVLSSNVASIAASVNENVPGNYHKSSRLQLQRIIEKLNQVQHRLIPGDPILQPAKPKIIDELSQEIPDPQLAEQLDFIYKLASDLDKTTREIGNLP